jgi:hypothetical protein
MTSRTLVLALAGAAVVALGLGTALQGAAP